MPAGFRLRMEPARLAQTHTCTNPLTRCSSLWRILVNGEFPKLWGFCLWKDVPHSTARLRTHLLCTQPQSRDGSHVFQTGSIPLPVEAYQDVHVWSAL